MVNIIDISDYSITVKRIRYSYNDEFPMKEIHSIIHSIDESVILSKGLDDNEVIDSILSGNIMILYLKNEVSTNIKIKDRVTFQYCNLPNYGTGSFYINAYDEKEKNRNKNNKSR